MSRVEIKNVSKSFGRISALSDVSLEFNENCIYGLLGRNGAGKSTLLNIISGRVFADEGQVLIDGEEAVENDKALSKVHLMSEQLLYAPTSRISDMLKISAYNYPDYDIEYAYKLCEDYKLDVKKRFNKLSTGYRTIAKCVNALACNAPIVFFDEPVLGLDANHRDMFYRQVLDHYNERPATYVISTHLIEEAANLIERAVVIKEGRLIANEEVDVLRSKGYSVSGKAGDVDAFAKGKEVIGEEALGGLKTVYIKGSRLEADIPPSLEVQPLSLQALFIKLTNS